MRKWDGRSTSSLEAKVRESCKEVLPGELLLQFPADSSPDRAEGLILLLILIKGLLIHIYKK